MSDEKEFSHDDLRDMSPPKYFFVVYTTARVDDKDPNTENPVIDQVFKNLGYYLNKGGEPGTAIVLKESDGRKEAVQYHPLSPNNEELMQAAGLEMHTQFDFLGEGPTDAVHDVTRALIDKGYEVVVPPLDLVLDRLQKFTPEENGKYRIETVMLRSKR